MDEKEFTASNFIPNDLLEIISILERGKKHHSYKIIRNRSHFSLIAKFPAGNGETTPLENNASVVIRIRNEFLPWTSLVVQSESVEKKIPHHMLLEFNLQVNVRKRNFTFLPMSG